MSMDQNVRLRHYVARPRHWCALVSKSHIGEGANARDDDSLSSIETRPIFRFASGSGSKRDIGNASRG